jgi:hypothetical protein
LSSGLEPVGAARKNPARIRNAGGSPPSRAASLSAEGVGDGLTRLTSYAPGSAVYLGPARCRPFLSEQFSRIPALAARSATLVHNRAERNSPMNKGGGLVRWYAILSLYWQMGRRGAGCRRRRRDETSCDGPPRRPWQPCRVTLSDPLPGKADGPIARRCVGRLVASSMRRPETHCRPVVNTSDEQDRSNQDCRPQN